MTPARETPGTLRNDLVALIQRQIITGDLPHGRSFSEKDLVERFAVSRAPVREALVILGELGWVTSYPRSGYVVPELSLAELRELFMVRGLLEPRAAALATATLRDHPEEAEALADFARAELDPSDPGWLDAHYRFHRRVAVLSMARELDRSLKQVLLKTERYLVLPSVREALDHDALDHATLLDALVSGSPAGASAAFALHVAHAQAVVVEGFLLADRPVPEGAGPATVPPPILPIAPRGDLAHDAS